MDLGPTCLNEIQSLDVYSDLTFAWTVAGPATLNNTTAIDPTVAVNEGNSTLTLTITNTATQEVFTTDVQITYQPITPTVTSVISNAHCIPLNNGAIDLTITYINDPYTVNWDGPDNYNSNQEDINGLFSGGYSLEITDADGCVYKTGFVVEQSVVTISESSNFTFPDQNCGSAGATIFEGLTIGSGDYSWNWTGPNNYTSTNDEGISGIAAGTYYYTVTDNVTGCHTSGDIIIGESTVTPLIDEDNMFAKETRYLFLRVYTIPINGVQVPVLNI